MLTGDKTVKAILISCSILIFLIFILFLSRTFWKNGEWSDLESSAEHETEATDPYTYMFGPDEIERALAQFPDLVVPEYVPDLFDLVELKVIDIDDYYHAGYFYQKEDRENEWDGLIISIRNPKDEQLAQSGSYAYVVDGIEFDDGYILYHEYPDSEILSASKVWVTGQSVFVSAAISKEELDRVLNGVPFPY